MSADFDVIVLGVGGMGSAACFELARRGRRVLGLEQFPLVHSHGSSHGQTRIIRRAYYEHPSYVPLVDRAFDRWYDLEVLTGRHLLTECDCLSIGLRGGELIRGVEASAGREHPALVRVASLTRDQVTSRFPFQLPDEDYTGVLEFGAGFLHVEECVRAHIDAAIALGVEIHAEEPVHEWKPLGDGVEVITEKGTYRAAKLIVTAGAWATRLLADIGVPLAVMRQVMLWFDATDRMGEFRRGRFPVFIADVSGGAFYGLPAIDRFGVKVARHYGVPELPNPDGVTWDVTSADVAPVREFLDEYIPGLGEVTKGQVCMYTVTPDRHFVIDVHPRYPQVSVACGFSGHGFKFAPTVGEVLADLAESGETKHRIELFSAKRFLGERGA